MIKKFKVIKREQVQRVVLCLDSSAIELGEGESLIECGTEKVRLGETFKEGISFSGEPVQAEELPQPREITAEDVYVIEIPQLQEELQEKEEIILPGKKLESWQIALASGIIGSASSAIYFFLAGG